MLGLNPSYKLILIYNIITFIGINNFSNICYAQENNVNNIKLTPYIECPKKGLCKLYQRENDVIQTTIKKISQYEYIFLGEVVHYYVNGYASSKMVDTNEIKKYNIIDNKFYLIKKNDPNDGYIVVDLNNNKLLLDYLKQICLYDIKTNKIDTIYNSKLRYGILIPYDDNNFIFTLENGLYKFDLATKSYSLIHSLDFKLGGKFLFLNNDIIFLYENHYGEYGFLYSIKQNKIIRNLKIKNTTAAEKISDKYILLIQTKTVNNIIEDNILIYDLDTGNVIKNIVLRKNGKFKEKYKLHKLNNGNILIYDDNHLFNIFDIKKNELKKLDNNYYFGKDLIQNIINVNDNRILINTKKNIFVYSY